MSSGLSGQDLEPWQASERGSETIWERGHKTLRSGLGEAQKHLKTFRNGLGEAQKS